jgi:hypothetical protein
MFTQAEMEFISPLFRIIVIRQRFHTVILHLAQNVQFSASEHRGTGLQAERLQYALRMEQGSIPKVALRRTPQPQSRRKILVAGRPRQHCRTMTGGNLSRDQAGNAARNPRRWSIRASAHGMAQTHPANGGSIRKVALRWTPQGRREADQRQHGTRQWLDNEFEEIELS